MLAPKPIFLVNPHAGPSGVDTLLAELKARKLPYFITDSKEAVPTFFATAAKDHQVVVVCGGDGTVNSILPYAVAGEHTFAVYPNGSGDGFAKEMGYTRDLDALLAAIDGGATQCIDVMQAGDHYACNVVGVGFDSYVAQEFAKQEGRGLKTYVVESTKAYQTFEPIAARITIDDTVIEEHFSMITVANTPQFGNNARIAPMADASDGLLDVVLVRPMPLFMALRFLVEVFAGREDGSRYVSYHRGRSVLIESECPHCQIDGETFAFRQNQLHVRIAGEARWVKA